jgi:hypothetical protein
VRTFRILCSLAILLLATAAPRPAKAQTGQAAIDASKTGLEPFGSYKGGNIDTINLRSGQLMVDIPIMSYPQRGGKLKLNFVLHYSYTGITVTPICIPGCFTMPY